MKVTRLGSAKHLHQYVDRIEIVINEVKYTITPYYGEGIRINCAGDESNIRVQPGCANEVSIIGS